MHPRVSLDVNPTSRQILVDLTRMGATADLVQAGARIHQTGCMGCIGMGQAPAIGRNSLRTVPRNFPGRSGTKDDLVWLCSPETAAAAALTGRITDPRDLDMDPPVVRLPEKSSVNIEMLEGPLPEDEARHVELDKAPSIGVLPELDPLPDEFEIPVVIKVGDDVSTDEILQVGARALPFRSDIARLADFTFIQLDEGYPERAREAGPHAVVSGRNYGQGSSPSTPRSRPATSGCGSSSPAGTRGSTGRTSSTSNPAARIRRRGRLRPRRAGRRAARGERPGRAEGRKRDRRPQRHQGRDVPGEAPPVRTAAGPGRRKRQIPLLRERVAR